MKIINKITGEDATRQAIEIIEKSLIKSGYTIAKKKTEEELEQIFDDFMDNLAINNGTTLY